MYKFLPNHVLDGGVSLANDEISIDFTLKTNLADNCVLRTYFVDKSSFVLKSLGVIEVQNKMGHFKRRCDAIYDTVAIALKNVDTNELTYVTAAFSGDEWYVAPVFSGGLGMADLHGFKLQTPPVENSGSAHFLSAIHACKEFQRYSQNIAEGFEFYKITEFRPIIPLSAYKYVLFERDVMYAFDRLGWYLFGIGENNLTAIAVAASEGARPLAHLGDIVRIVKLDEVFYHIAVIELADDGQYFVSWQ